MIPHDRFPALQHLLQAYLNEDWPEEYGRPSDAVEDFLYGEAELAAGLEGEISDALMSYGNEVELKKLIVNELGSGYLPSADGLTFESWLVEVARSARRAVEDLRSGGPQDVRAPTLVQPEVSAQDSSVQDPGSSSSEGRHVRRGTGEYFENEIADRWVLRHWGYWGEVMALMGLPMAVESDVHFRCDSSSLALRSEVADYLDAAPYAVTGMKPPSPCYLCDWQVLPAAHRSDGVWLWPEYMGHLVRDHEFVVPNAMVDHIRAQGRPPADLLGVDVDRLPWPNRPG